MRTPDEQHRAFDNAVADFLSRLDQGEAPDAADYLARYPTCAGELRRFFSDFDYVDDKVREETAATRKAGLGQWFVDSRTPEGPHRERDGSTLSLPRIRGYQVLQELGGGSQGVVYKAVQLGTKRPVALKIIREGAFATRAERRRFENEVELASQLNHPNIVAIYSCGQDAGRDYFAMEFVDGEPLDVYVDTRTLDIPATLELFLQIASAISFAHRYGVIHRDLKPSNVIVDSLDRPRILDFGLAKGKLQRSGEGDAALTRPGEFAGTWYYASPEQAKRDPGLVDVRTDVYALGVILFEMLTDCLPYPIYEEPGHVIAKHILETPPIRPSTIRRGIDDDLDTIVLRALAKEPERRYDSVGALSEDIEHYLRGEAIVAKRDSAWYVFKKFLGRHRWQALTVAVGLSALIAFSVTVSMLYSQALSARAREYAAHATTEVRGDIARTYAERMMLKLDELNWATNRLDHIADVYPGSPIVGEFFKQPYDDGLELFCQIAEGMPPQIIDAVWDPAASGYKDAARWLKEHDDGLTRIADLSKTYRFICSTHESTDLEFVLATTNLRSMCARQTCHALAARGLEQYRKGDHAAAAADFEAARAVALDIADGRRTFHKALSIGARSRLYDVVLTIINSPDLTPEAARPYWQWILRDPPIPRYRPAMLAEQFARSQLIERASLGTVPGEPGYIDLAALDGLTGGYYASLGKLTPQVTGMARSTKPSVVLDVVQEYFGDIELWDRLGPQALERRAGEVISTSHTKPIAELGKPLLPRYVEAFKERGRVRSRRAAMMLAARLCQYRGQTGQWPTRLDDALPADPAHGTTDPYLGVPFGYKLVGDTPLVYSVNEDGTDDGGVSGRWGDPGTDVVLFPMSHE
ncbi:MAG: serine/threonine-protein kinase [Phycisphaerae bacterium]|jgi:predicted Ser/Thr protein kinase